MAQIWNLLTSVLHILHPEAFVPQDLDFYVPQSGAHEFKEALHQRGYKEKEDQPKCRFYGDTPVAKVGHLYKVGISGSINLIITCSPNPLSVIVKFHSTLVMNVITSDGVLCLYPLLTLAGQGVMTRNTRGTRSCFLKYIFHGFTLKLQFTQHQCMSTAYCHSTMGSIDNPDVLVVPFTRRGSRESTLDSFSPFHWQVGKVAEDEKAIISLSIADRCTSAEAALVPR
ncbi:hypothetical protein CPB84DRAFT_1753147 [Gymnopilus junonius]|uniref:Uncharacterized protein n=1 Tax=Gymnopilus junonius TaxID=109634 RepID=A0A9P5NBK7_GYMJU|nr:hypothetical protein CPB84DRAFT_1753147 [Gymnopilus junonius]